MNFDVNIDDLVKGGYEFFLGVRRITDNLKDIDKLMKIYHFTLLFHKYFKEDIKERKLATEKIIDVLNGCSLLMNDNDLIMNLFDKLPDDIQDAISIDASLSNLDIYNYIINFKK